MAVIVQHKKSKNRYVLLGAGFAAYKSTRPGAITGSWAPVTDGKEVRAVLVCDAAGATLWIESDALEVVSIDGQTAAEVLE